MLLLLLPVSYFFFLFCLYLLFDSLRDVYVSRVLLREYGTVFNELTRGLVKGHSRVVLYLSLL